MFGIIALALSGLATGASVISGNKARRSQERAGRVQQAIETRGAQRDRMQQLREAQIARASAVQQGVSSGVADSSGLSGQLAGIQSTAASNLAFSQQTESGVGIINNFNRRAGRYMSQAGTYGAVSNLAMTGASFAGSRGGSTASANKPKAASTNSLGVPY